MATVPSPPDIEILDEGAQRGWSELCYPATYPLQGHASFNTKTEYILALP